MLFLIFAKKGNHVIKFMLGYFKIKYKRDVCCYKHIFPFSGIADNFFIVVIFINYFLLCKLSTVVI